MEYDEDITWISGSSNLLKIIALDKKPYPNDANQPSYAAEGNEFALWNQLQLLNDEQSDINEEHLILAPYRKENDFIQLLLTIESENVSTELFNLLFDIVDILFFTFKISSQLNFFGK